MKLLKEYFKLQAKIYKYFGYKENWATIPLDDQTDSYWLVVQEVDGCGRVCYSDVPLTAETISAGSEIYGASIYTQRFLPKWVYRAKRFTMVCVDTHTDGNKFLMVFDNSKECKSRNLKALYLEEWGHL